MARKFFVIVLWVLLIGIPFALARHTRPFPDVSRDNPYHVAIVFFESKGVIHGYSDGEFRPYILLTRAEATRITYRATHSDLPKQKACYSDVKRQQWFSRYVCNSSFISGYSDGSFRPRNKINIRETVKMAYKAYTGSYPVNFLERAKEQNFIRRNVKGHEWITRGEFVAILYKFHVAYKPQEVATSATSTAYSSPPPQNTLSSSQIQQAQQTLSQSSQTLQQQTQVQQTQAQQSQSPPQTQTQTQATQTTQATSSTTQASTTQTLSAQYSERFINAFNLGLQFFEEDLSSSAGAIYSNLDTNYEPSDVVGVNHEILSEAYGLILTALAQSNKQASFEKYYQFLDTRLIDHQKNLVVWKLREDLTVYQYANAMIDDMRILRSLLLGFEKFGVAKYRDTALAIANSIKLHGTRNNVLVSHIGWNVNEDRYFPASDLRLGYADVATAKKLATYDSAWSTIATATQQVLIGGQYPSGLFHFKYKFNESAYESDSSLETIFQAYTGEYLAEAGERIASQKMLDFFKNQWTTNRKIFNNYRPDGTSSSSSENLAVYGMISRMAYHLGDREFAEKMGDKLVSLLINQPTSNYHGAFAWSIGERIYSFNQGNALQTLALLGTTPSLPPPPPPTVASNQFILWHMADIYYGSHHNGPCATMVDDMDTLPWSKAVVAGDLSGDGSLQNYDGVLNCFAKSDHHTLSDIKIVAGNHEYNCGGTADEGCLNNYKSKIRPDLYYTWDQGNIHFIMFSPDRVRYDVKDSTFEWIRNEVASNQDKIVVLVNHHMPHSFGSRSQQILDQLGVDLWLFGHAHCKHGDNSCIRHGALGDFYQQAETTFVDAGYIGNMESRYIIFTDGSDQVTIRSRNHQEGQFQSQFEHTVRLRRAVDF